MSQMTRKQVADRFCALALIALVQEFEHNNLLPLSNEQLDIILQAFVGICDGLILHE